MRHFTLSTPCLGHVAPDTARSPFQPLVSMRYALLLCVLLASPASAQSPLAITVDTARKGVVVISGYSNGNILALATLNGVFLVDAQSAERVGQADSARQLHAPGNVKWVVNTHYHGDHTEGNAIYRQMGAAVTAHPNAILQAQKDTTVTELAWHRTPLPAGAMPTRALVGQREVIALGGGDTAVLLAPGPSHTGGDIMVYLPRHNVLHTGDIVERQAFPFIDWWSGGSLDGMIAGVDSALTWTNDHTRYVPGHGTIASRTEILAYRAMLVDMRVKIRSAVARRLTERAWTDEHPTAIYEGTFGSVPSGSGFAKNLFLGCTRAGATC